MKFTPLFLSFVLSSVVIAKGHGGNSTKEISDKSLCKDMRQLTKIVETASNATRLADKTNNATKIAAFQAKASTASAKLATMSTNATLVSSCAMVNAAEDTKDDCQDMEHLTKLMAMMGNAAAIEAKTHGNTTQMAKLKAKAAEGMAKLQVLQANATLMAECAKYAAGKTSKKASKNNGTATAGAEKATTSGTAASATAVKPSDANLVDARFGVLFTVLLVTVGTLVL